MTPGRRAFSCAAASAVLMSCNADVSQRSLPSADDAGRPEASAEPAGSDLLPEPRLSDLAVLAGASPLNPPFHPHTFRYSVRADPSASLELLPRAALGLHVAIDDVELDPGTSQTVPAAAPGTEVEVRVENADGAAANYTVVVLPVEFPEIEVSVREETASSDPIYVALRGEDLYYLAKLDNGGVPYFYRRAPRSIYDFKRHPGGELSYALRTSPEGPAEQIVLDEAFREVDRVVSVGLVDTDQHEFLVLPNGNYVLLAYEPAFRDLRPFGGGVNQRVFDGVFQEITRERRVVFEWNSWGHLPYDEAIDGGQDYAHLNSISVDEDGHWLVSSRGLSQVVKIDRESGEVLWRLGGKSSDFTFVDDPFANLCGQHTATRTPQGTLLIFDNGQHCWPESPERGELTRVVEYELDEVLMTATLVFSYQREGAYTVSQGSAQRLRNGNTFIGWGQGTALLATEVDPEGEVVFEIQARALDAVLMSYRALRFPD